MNVVGLVWVGVRTGKFEETVEFFRSVLELPVGLRRRHFVRLDLPDASVVEVFDPASGEYPHFTTGPVLGFQVTDFDAARTELAGGGCGLLLPVGGERGEYRWQHFRAPDGMVYEIVDYPNRPRPQAASGAIGVTKLVWSGLSTSTFSTTAGFYRDTLGLRVVEETPDLIECVLPDGGGLEAFRRGSAMDHPHFRTGLVPGFGVADIDHAVRILGQRGVPLVETRRRVWGGWAHFRAPDGNIYEVKGGSAPRAR
ncbi:MAG: VOC family protein [Thermoplasmata archaeon]|nr:VOC family protein [Thermoplasmata archaeon]